MSNKDVKILYIDDEEPNLIAFKAIFRRRFNVMTTTSGDGGLELLRLNSDIKVVISDQKMDNESGVEFFCRMIPLFPSPIRIILTGFTNHQAMTDAINLANVYRFITKPWNEIDLTKTIESAIELYDNRIDLKKINSNLKHSYDEISKFVYSVTHDMRTPIASILGLIEQAKKEEQYKEDNKYFSLVEKNILKLNSYVKNVIDFHENKERKSDIEAVDFEVLIDEILNSLNFYPQLQEINIEKRIQIKTSFYCDKFRLRVILSNLLSNAIKYQCEDRTSKKLVIEACDYGNGIEMKITDNGVGIPSASLDNLFDIFYHSQDSTAGSGIGLYIVNEAIKNLSGDLDVESVLGQGSIFTVFLPNMKKSIQS